MGGFIMSKYLVIIQITYENQAKISTTVVEADNKVLAARSALIDQISTSDLIGFEEAAKKKNYLEYKERFFTYKTLGVIELQTLPLMIDGRDFSILISTDNEKLKKLKPIKKNKSSKPFLVDVEWIAEGKHRKLNSVLMADDKKDAVVKVLLSLCRTTDEWGILDQIEANGEDLYDITIDGSQYIASPAISMELVDIAIKGGCVTALIPMQTNDPGQPIVATLGLPYLSLISTLSDSKEYP